MVTGVCHGSCSVITGNGRIYERQIVLLVDKESGS
jgi:hypothetical protein